MSYFPVDFVGQSIDGHLFDTGSLIEAVSEMDLRKIRVLALQTNINQPQPPYLRINLTIEQFQSPNATVQMQLEIANLLYMECFRVITDSTNPLFGKKIFTREKQNL